MRAGRRDAAHTCTQRVAAMLQSVTLVQVRSRCPAPVLEAPPQGFRIHPEELRTFTISENSRRWKAYGPVGDGGLDITDESAKERYLRFRVSGYLANCDAPEYKEWQEATRRKKQKVPKL